MFVVRGDLQTAGSLVATECVLRAALPLLGSSLEPSGGGATDLRALNFIYIGDDNPTVTVVTRRPKVTASAARGCFK